MNRAEIIDKLKDILAATDGSGKDKFAGVTDSTALATELGFTSVNILYMVIVIEEAFGIRFENVRVSSFATVGDVVDYIEGAMK